MKLPYVSDELIEYLEKTYPDQSPSPDMTERRIWMAAGAVQVVRNLKMLHEDNIQKALKSPQE